MASAACDDGKVEKLGSGYTTIACVLWSEGPIGAEIGVARVDGLDASSVVAAMLQILAGRHGVRLEALLLDSLTVAGFNVISPPTIMRLTGAPTIVTYKYKPDSARLRAALEKHFADWRIRMRVLSTVDGATEMETRKGRLYILSWGMELERAKRIVESLQIYSRIPEPLRLAHMLASEAYDLLKRSGAGGGI